jgi:hypothetical protein
VKIELRTVPLKKNERNNLLRKVMVDYERSLLRHWKNFTVRKRLINLYWRCHNHIRPLLLCHRENEKQLWLITEENNVLHLY